MCDSLRTNLTSISKKCLKSLFQPLVKNGKLEVTFLPIDKQTDGFNCGLFPLGYASILLDGKSPVDVRFVENEMRLKSLCEMLERRSLIYFTNTSESR